MITSEKLLLVLLTAPDSDTADKLTNALLEDRVAACVTRIPGALSLYHWEGGIERSEEIVLLVKTRSSRFGELERTVLRVHPYETPEIVAVQASAVLEKYAEWVVRETKPTSAQK